MERRPSLTMSSIIRACCLLTSRANGNQNLVFNSDIVEVMIGNLLFNPDDEASQSTHTRVLLAISCSTRMMRQARVPIQGCCLSSSLTKTRPTIVMPWMGKTRTGKRTMSNLSLFTDSRW